MVSDAPSQPYFACGTPYAKATNASQPYGPNWSEPSTLSAFAMAASAPGIGNGGRQSCGLCYQGKPVALVHVLFTPSSCGTWERRATGAATCITPAVSSDRARSTARR
jgi:hypothetical protein